MYLLVIAQSTSAIPSSQDSLYPPSTNRLSPPKKQLTTAHAIPPHSKVHSHDNATPLRKRQFRRPSTPSSSPTISLPSAPSSPQLPFASDTPSTNPSTAKPVALILPQNEPNATHRVFPYTPPTGANNSLYLTPNVTVHPGMVEIKVGLLLPYSLPNNLTQQLAYSGTSAIRLAVSEINARGLIPGAYITLVLKDSFNGLDPENSGAAQAIFSTVALLQTDGGVSGVIGDVSSALSVQSALLTSRLDIPQCSFSAGSTQLSNKEDYGHFFRTIPTELMFARVMLEFVASRGWKRIAVFYTSDSFGSEMMDRIVVQASRRNITIGYRRAFWEMGTSSDLGPGLDALRDSGQQIVVVAATGPPQIRLMTEAVKRGLVSKDYVWLAINQVTEPLLGENSTLKPTDLNGLFMFDNLLRLHGYPPYEEFLDKWAALDPAEYPYAGQRDISSNEAQAYSCMHVLASGFANAVKGNWTALHMLANGRLGSKLKPMDMNTNITGPGGPMVFDESGDMVYGNFILYNFQHGEAVSIGTSYSGIFNISSPPMYFDGSYDPPADSAPLRVLNPKFGSSIGMVIISVAGLSILFSLLAMLIVVVYKNAQVIKASSPLFCCLELCGFILLYTSTVMGLDIPTNAICMARPMMLNIGFVLVVGNIVAKNFRVYRIFHNIYVTKRVIRDSHLLKIVGTILSGVLIIMTVWFLKAPPTRQQVIMPDFTTYYTCNNQSGAHTPFFVILLVYNASLLLIATYLAYRNRNVAANYNECRQIAFVVYNILLSGCLAMPTLFLSEDQFLTKFFLSTVVILFGTTFSLMFLFLPKLWELFTQMERNPQHDRHGAHGGGGGNGYMEGGGSEEGSLDGFIGWMNAGPNGALGAGAGSTAGGSQILGGRKGSVGTLDESRGDTLKETHMGYMGVKFQNRYWPFLSSWCMRRLILYPAGRYFTCFELGKPETGRTFTYIGVFIHSNEPDKYILRIVGCGRCDFLLQVRDEERLLYWYGLFENKQTNLYGSSTNLGSFMPLGNLSAAAIGNRSESDQTLQATLDGLQVSAFPTSLDSASAGSASATGQGMHFDGSKKEYRDGKNDDSPSSRGLQTSQQYQYQTTSSYTMATLTGSPSASLTDMERSRTLVGLSSALEDDTPYSHSHQQYHQHRPQPTILGGSLTQELSPPRPQHGVVDLNQLSRVEEHHQQQRPAMSHVVAGQSGRIGDESMEMTERRGQLDRMEDVDLDRGP